MKDVRTSVSFLLNEETVTSLPKYGHTPISILNILPSELTSEIFSRLSFCRKDIAACRLVCREFCALSSPYLITYAVFSTRQPALEKLHQLIQHSYFSKHVRELLFDFSSYVQDLRYLWDYVPACSSSGRTFQPKSQDEDHHGHRLPPPLPGGALHSPLNRAAPYIAEAADYGHYQGMQQYIQLRALQLRAEESGVPERLLDLALEKLVGVREVTFGDYRCLIRSRESMNQLCARLFGNILQPSFSDCEDILGRTLRERVDSVLSRLPKDRIHRLSFGLHPFYKEQNLALWEPFENERRGDYIEIRNDGVEIHPAKSASALHRLRFTLLISSKVCLAHRLKVSSPACNTSTITANQATKATSL